LSFAKTGSALISVAVCVSGAGDLTNTIAGIKAVGVLNIVACMQISAYSAPHEVDEVPSAARRS
jgi:hypothetical protein